MPPVKQLLKPSATRGTMATDRLDNSELYPELVQVLRHHSKSASYWVNLCQCDPSCLSNVENINHIKEALLEMIMGKPSCDDMSISENWGTLRLRAQESRAFHENQKQRSPTPAGVEVTKQITAGSGNTVKSRTRRQPSEKHAIKLCLISFCMLIVFSLVFVQGTFYVFQATLVLITLAK
ncbi:hypothetical protein CEUSTIGMA_g13856.t1 [Chlamydomonas eustigma]|uniref:Uncharacterized protein n=1 Tax=Chlamydomonas eustigma TaxID=1157962 RepID=A0A250XTT1_9CHLO|nr:hypothetical protein CEUSTIGMA_g13856.t1 [Chlamydomonas eustigma]|eukprot:GAX86446.1 hypothetical protein CEUSTIGMA_g13856.t1 [Chlamydomonas eustigma]